MDSVKYRLEKVKEITGFSTRKEFSKSVGVSYTTMNKWIERGEITPNGLVKITKKYPTISYTYMETGEGDILKLDTGISNYGHDARKNEVCNAYDSMSNADKEIIYNISMRLKSDKFSHLDDVDILGED